jgi:hypothetical protein
MTIIQGSKFAEHFLCYKPEINEGFLKKYNHEHYYSNTVNVSELKHGDIIFCKTGFIEQFFKLIKDVKVHLKLITHNSDYSINETRFQKKPDCIKAWWGQNIDYSNNNLFSLPIGLENIWWRGGLQYNTIINKLAFGVFQKKSKLIYVNHAQRNEARREAYTYFADKTYSTTKHSVGYNQYIQDIVEHQFVLCPDGNGIDTHRLWECLYVGSIPIVFKGINTNFYRNLPITFIDSYGEITESFLQNEFTRITNIKWSFESLDLKYWIDLIKNYKI